MLIHVLLIAMKAFWMPAITDLPESLARHLSKMEFAGGEDLWVRDWSGKLPNFSDNGLMWVLDPSTGRSLMMLRGRDMAWTTVNRPSNLAAVSEIMTVPEEDDASSVKRFMRQLVQLLHDPRVTVCDPVLGHQPDEVLETYLVDGGPGAGALRDECTTSPSINRNETSWRGTISVLDYNGALLEVRAAGKLAQDTVERFDVRTIYPGGSFFFADEF